MLNAIMPVQLGGRYQNTTGVSQRVIVPSDAVPLGPCTQIIVSSGGNLSLQMWDGSVVTYAVVAGQVINVSPRFVKATGTTVVAGGLLASY